MRWWKATAAIVLGVALIGSAPGRAASRALQIGVGGRVNAYASVAATGRFAVLGWGASTKEGASDVYVAVSRDGGRSFGAPARVSHAGDEARLSGEQPVRLVLVPRADRDPVLLVVWTAKASDGTRLLSSRSEDGGRTFSTAVPLPGSDAPGNRGWESVAARGDGSAVALWLDHRELATGAHATVPMNHAEHQHLAAGGSKSDGVARAQLSKLFFASLGTSGSARAIAAGVCYCCKTAVATDETGAIYAAWRQVYDGNVRDIAFSKSADGGRTFTSSVRVSDDNWVLDGCPENGPAIAVDSGRRIHVAWPTLVPGAAAGSDPTLALFYATSGDGRRFSAREQVPTEGVPRHAQVAIDRSGQVVLGWDEQAPGVRRIALARRVGGSPGFTRQAIDSAAATYPAIAAADDGVIVAWTSGGREQSVIRVERLSEK